MEYDYTFFADGATEPTNPGGTSGIGCAVYEGKKLVKEYSYYISAKPQNTNNVAEYIAFIRALKHIDENKITSKSILIQGDSMLCVKQLNGDWGIKAGQYMKYAYMARDLLIEARKNNVIDVKWIPREQNTVADDLSKKELIRNGITITKRK